MVAGPSIVVSLLARQFNVLSLGDGLAVGLGSSLMRSRILIGAVATLLAAGAVSIAELVGLVGLIVPHGVRLLAGKAVQVTREGGLEGDHSMQLFLIDISYQ